MNPILRSDNADFSRAHNQDAGSGELADPYYYQTNAVAVRGEAFAEIHAEYLRDPDAMILQYSSLYGYWHHRLGDE